MKRGHPSWTNAVLLGLLLVALVALFLLADRRLAHAPVPSPQTLDAGGAAFPPTPLLPLLHVRLLYLAAWLVWGLWILEFPRLLLPAALRPRVGVVGAAQALLVAGFLLDMELGLRVELAPYRTRGYMAPEAERYWTFNRATADSRFTVNAFGLRGVEIDPDKRPGEFRILCLGDSITAGNFLAEKQTYPFLLQAWLRKRFPGRLIRVQNGAVYGYSIVQGAMVFDRVAEAFKPDLVLLGFTHFNLTMVDQDDEPFLSHRWPLVELRRLAFQSTLYMTLRQTLRPHPVRGFWPLSSEESGAEDRRRQDRLNEKYVLWFRDQARRRGFQVVLYRPYHHEGPLHAPGVRPSFSAQTPGLGFALVPDLEQELPPHRVPQGLREFGLPLVDLERGWRTIPDVGRFLQDSSHPNIPGTVMQARDLGGFLVEEGLVPGDPR